MTRAAAIEFVRDMIRNVRQGQSIDAGQLAWRERIKLYPILNDEETGILRDGREYDWTVDTTALPELLSHVDTDGAAYDVATTLMCAFLRWERTMPKILAAYAARRISGEAKKPHRKLGKNTFRDELAAIAIRYLHERAGINPDRNGTSVAKCGIEIVTEFLSEAGYTATPAAIRSAYYKKQ